jgi:hypothetical protein
MTAKKWLVIVGVILILMGIGGLIPNLGIGTEPAWHALAKIVIGVLSLVFAKK